MKSGTTDYDGKGKRQNFYIGEKGPHEVKGTMELKGSIKAKQPTTVTLPLTVNDNRQFPGVRTPKKLLGQ